MMYYSFHSDPEPLHGRRDHLADGTEVVVALPVRVDEVLAVGPAPRLAVVDVRADRGLLVAGDDEAVEAAEVAEHEVGVVVDVLVAREEHRVDLQLAHQGPELLEPALHLRIGEHRLHRLPVRKRDERRSLETAQGVIDAALPLLPSTPFEIPEDIRYVRVDPKTGLLAPEQGDQGIVEVFTKGTEPTETAPEMAEMDQPNCWCSGTIRRFSCRWIWADPTPQHA